MLTGSFAAAIPVFMSTPSTPCSMVTQASDAVPTPASTMIGTLSRCLIVRTLKGLRSPSPDPIGAANGMTATAPASSNLRAVIKSSFVYAMTWKPSAARAFVASTVPTGSGSKVSWSAITSSLIHSLNPAARARRAYRTASVTLVQPAVFASRKYRAGSRWCRITVSFDRSRSTRRTATVTTSAPEASIARIMTSFVAYFPVPTMSRDRNSWPAITSVSAVGRVNVATVSPSTDEMHELQDVALSQGQCAELVSLPQDRPVALDDDHARVQPEAGEQSRDSLTVLRGPWRSVNGQLHAEI